ELSTSDTSSVPGNPATAGNNLAPRKACDPLALFTTGWSLRFDDRRDDVFGRTFVDAMPEGAVVNAVKKIDSQPNGEPPEETNPRFERQAAHKGKAHDHAQDWEQWNERNTKRT